MRAALPAAIRRAILVLPCAMLVACVARAPVPVEPAGLQAPDAFPQALYREAQARGQEVLRIDPRESTIVVEVRRGGPLAGIGHDHVVASRDVQGYVLPSAGHADLFIPLLQLTVDEAALRAESGMAKPPSAEAIEGTRRNLLDKVLDAERFPFALVRIDRKEGNALRVAITLHGRTREVEVPSRIDHTAGKLNVSGSMTLRQSDFGITPFAVLGGALQVQDALTLRYRIVARSS